MPPTNFGNRLPNNTAMLPHDFLEAGGYRLTMQKNGELTLGLTGQAVGPWNWESYTAVNFNAWCKVLESGDFVVFDMNNNPLKHSQSTGASCQLWLTDDGNLIIINDDRTPVQPPWDNGDLSIVPSLTVLAGELLGALPKFVAPDQLPHDRDFVKKTLQTVALLEQRLLALKDERRVPEPARRDERPHDVLVR